MWWYKAVCLFVLIFLSYIIKRSSVGGPTGKHVVDHLGGPATPIKSFPVESWLESEYDLNGREHVTVHDRDLIFFI